MKNLTEFCKTVKTGVDPRLRRISIIISKLEVRGFEPRTFRMQSGRSTTELHPRLASKCWKFAYRS